MNSFDNYLKELLYFFLLEFETFVSKRSIFQKFTEGNGTNFGTNLIEMYWLTEKSDRIFEKF